MKIVFFALLLCLQVSRLQACADVSFVIIDLKYNRRQGVKICEMQPASFSRFSGSEALYETNIVPNLYCDFLEKYKIPLYFTHPIPPKIKEAFCKRGGRSIRCVEKLNQTLRRAAPHDPDNISDYECFLFSLCEGSFESFSNIFFLDRAILPYSKNKYLMNVLFDHFEESRKLRPQWKIYRKGFSEGLVRSIMDAIPGDRIVIKPLESTMGRGVIILDKKDLSSTLNYIFNTDEKILLDDMERSYSQYAIDSSDFFIVEEFIASDPLFLGPDSKPYDCTMRVMAVLSYHLKQVEVTFLNQYWYSPHKPIDDAYTLIQSHKAKGSFFQKVSLETKEEVERQLRPALLAVYQRMLE